jgi:hypothetical protein
MLVTVHINMLLVKQSISILGVGILAASAYAQTQNLLPDGTPVRMRIGRNLSSADAQVGENVDFEVLDEVKINELVVIPRGATAMATVTDAKSKKSMGRAGHLDVNIDYVRTASGEKIPLRGIQDAKAGGHVGAMTGAIVATSIVFFPAAPLFLFIKGKDITIPKGHEITAYINGDFKIDPAKFTTSIALSPNSAATPKLTGKVLTNDDILNLKNGGFSDELIIAKVKSSPGDYKLDTDDLLSLKKGGLSDVVIAAMVTATK